MNTAMYEAATSRQVFGYVLILIAGVVLVGGLIWAFRLGFKVRQREPAPPLPEEQPKLPPEGAVHEIRENRDYQEVPKTPKGGRPLTPYELSNMDSKSSEDQKRPRWSSGSSGSFGGGGLGAH